MISRITLLYSLLFSSFVIAKSRKLSIRSRKPHYIKDTTESSSEEEPVDLNEEIVKKSLNTNYEGTAQMYGNMFDIKSNRNLTITTMSIHTNKSTSVEIWTRKTSFQDMQSSEGWSLVCSTSIFGGKAREETKLPEDEFNDIQVNAGETHAFYVILPGAVLLSTSVEKQIGTAFVSNNDLDILVGASNSKDEKFEVYLNETVHWNGAFYYQVQRIESNQLVTSFSSTFLTSSTTHSILFQLRAWTNIVITSFDLHVNSTQAEDISVKAINGDYVNSNSNNSKEEWETIYHNNQIKCQGINGITSLSPYNFHPITLAVGDVKSFVVTIQSSSALVFEFSSNSINTVATTNDELQMQNGYIMTNETTVDYRNLVTMQGVVHYSSFKPPILNQVFFLDATTDILNNTSTAFGIAFDIIPKQKILIDAMQLISSQAQTTNSSTNTNFTIWTKSGSIQNLVKFTIDEWILVYSSQLQDQDTKILTSPLHFETIYLEANVTQSLLISLSNSNTLTVSKTNEGTENYNHDNTIEDSNLQIIQGREVMDTGEITFQPISFVGGIYYSIQTIYDSQPDKTILPSSTYIPGTILNSTSSLMPTDILKQISQIPLSNENYTLPNKIATANPSELEEVLIDNITETPNSIPSPTESESPSSTVKKTMTVNYTFALVHPYESESQLLHDVTTHVTQSLYQILSKPSKNLLLQTYANVSMESVISIVRPDLQSPPNCKSTEEETCSIVTSMVRVYYKQGISTDLIRYLVLSLATDVTKKFSFSYKEYMGSYAYFAMPIVVLVGDEDMQQLDNDSIDFYENTVTTFFKEVSQDFPQDFPQDLIITGITTSLPQLHTNKNNTTDSEAQRRKFRSRLLQNVFGDSHEIMTGVISESTKEEFNDAKEYSSLIKKTIDGNSDYLLKKLKEDPVVFGNVDFIIVNLPDGQELEPNPETNENTDDENGMTDLILPITAAATFVIVVILAIVLLKIRKTKNDKRKEDVDAFQSNRQLTPTQTRVNSQRLASTVSRQPSLTNHDHDDEKFDNTKADRSVGTRASYRETSSRLDTVSENDEPISAATPLKRRNSLPSIPNSHEQQQAPLRRSQSVTSGNNRRTVESGRFRRSSSYNRDNTVTDAQKNNSEDTTRDSTEDLDDDGFI